MLDYFSAQILLFFPKVKIGLKNAIFIDQFRLVAKDSAKDMNYQAYGIVPTCRKTQEDLTRWNKRFGIYLISERKICVPATRYIEASHLASEIRGRPGAHCPRNGLLEE